MKPEFKIISNLINKNSHVLDVGCGDGILMEFLIQEILVLNLLKAAM